MSGAERGAGQVRFVTEPAALVEVYEADVDAVVWSNAVAVDAWALPSAGGRAVIDPAAPPPLWTPLQEVIEVFATLADCRKLGLRWRALFAPMCPAFHVDRVELRGCLTLRGPGTELQSKGGVVRAAAGDLVVMKGTLLSDRGCLHRSPPHGPLEGERRVLTFDPL